MFKRKPKPNQPLDPITAEDARRIVISSDAEYQILLKYTLESIRIEASHGETRIDIDNTSPRYFNRLKQDLIERGFAYENATSWEWRGGHWISWGTDE